MYIMRKNKTLGATAIFMKMFCRRMDYYDMVPLHTINTNFSVYCSSSPGGRSLLILLE